MGVHEVSEMRKYPPELSDIIMDVPLIFCLQQLLVLKTIKFSWSSKEENGL